MVFYSPNKEEVDVGLLTDRFGHASPANGCHVDQWLSTLKSFQNRAKSHIEQ